MKKEPTGLILRQLTQMAHSLPREVLLDEHGNKVTEREKKSGKQLISEGKKFIGNEKIIKGKSYDVVEFVYVNHYNNLIKAYKANGQDGADEYMRSKKIAAWNSFSRLQRAGFILKSIIRKITKLFSFKHK